VTRALFRPALLAVILPAMAHAGEHVDRPLGWTGHLDRYPLDAPNLTGGDEPVTKRARAWLARSTAHHLVRAPQGPSGPGGARAVVRRCDGAPRRPGPPPG